MQYIYTGAVYATDIICTDNNNEHSHIPHYYRYDYITKQYTYSSSGVAVAALVVVAQTPIVAGNLKVN